MFKCKYCGIDLLDFQHMCPQKLAYLEKQTNTQEKTILETFHHHSSPETKSKKARDLFDNKKLKKEYQDK